MLQFHTMQLLDSVLTGTQYTWHKAQVEAGTGEARAYGMD